MKLKITSGDLSTNLFPTFELCDFQENEVTSRCKGLMTVQSAQHLSPLWELACEHYGGVSGSVIWGWGLQAWGIRMSWR